MVNLQRFRSLQLPPKMQRLGEWAGRAVVLYWFWWILIEKGALDSLLNGPGLMEILLGLPLILILPAIFYTMVFLLLRVVIWSMLPPEQEVDAEREE